MWSVQSLNRFLTSFRILFFVRCSKCLLPIRMSASSAALYIHLDKSIIFVLRLCRS